MHRITWPQMGPFIRREVGAMLEAATLTSVNTPLLLHETPVPYRISTQLRWTERVAA